MKKYPLDITVACSIGLEGGLIRFKDIWPDDFSKKDFDLIHEWNLCLKETIKEPEFKEYMTMKYRILLNFSPVTLSKIIDKLAVPYRSYYYAKRFLDSAHFVYEHAEQNSNVIDFGCGLSPWGHVVKQNCPDIQMYTFDNEQTNLVFSIVSKKLKLPIPHFNENPVASVFDKDIFVSLGTFAYLNPVEQSEKLKWASKKCKHLFIEMDKPNAVQQQDEKLVNNLGAEYNPGFSKQQLKEILGTDIPFNLREIAVNVKNASLAQALKTATEQFIVR